MGFPIIGNTNTSLRASLIRPTGGWISGCFSLTGSLQRKNQEAFQGQGELKPWKAKQILDGALSLVVTGQGQNRAFAQGLVLPCCQLCQSIISEYLWMVEYLSILNLVTDIFWSCLEHCSCSYYRTRRERYSMCTYTVGHFWSFTSTLVIFSSWKNV